MTYDSVSSQILIEANKSLLWVLLHVVLCGDSDWAINTSSACSREQKKQRSFPADLVTSLQHISTQPWTLYYEWRM